MAAGHTAIELLDESSLSGENGEIYLFQWLSSTESSAKKATLEELKTIQGDLEVSLLKVISAPEPYPLPGRPIRRLVAGTLKALYMRGETKSLFDTIQSFLKLLAETKPTAKESSRIAAVYCIGELMGMFGSQVMSLMSEVATVTIKLCRSSSSIILRTYALQALSKALSTAKRAVTDSVAKDIIKHSKNALSDKALPVQRAACEALVLMYPAGDGTRSVADVESILNICVKSLESADQLTRRSLAKLVAHMLASTQVEKVVPIPDAAKKGKKARKEGEDEDEDTAPGAHVTAEESKPIMTPSEMLLQLSAHFNKPQASRKTRVGIFDFYSALLTLLGTSFVESNYALVANHLMTEIVANSRNSGTRYEVVFVRSLIEIILRDLVGVRLLGEQAQIAAIQELSSTYLKRWPALMPGQSAPSPLCLVIALREVSGLLQQLGNAPGPVQDALLDPLLNLLSHPSHSVRVNTAWALRCFCYSTPIRLPKVLLSVVEKLQRDLSSLTTPAAPSDIHLRALGQAYGLSALLAVIPDRPLYVSHDISAKVYDICVQILKRAGDHDVKVAQVEIEIAWTCIASLMTLGPNFVRPHLPQLLVLWRNALPKPTTKDGATARSVSEWEFLLHVRESTVGAVHCFLKYNSPTLVTADVTRRISSLLSNGLAFANTYLSSRTSLNQEELVGDSKGLNIDGREALLRSRIFQCFSLLGFGGVTESVQGSLLQSVVTLFSSSDGYAGSSVQAAIASSSGSFTSVWQSVDGYAYGVTSLQVDESPREWLNRDGIETSVDDMCQKPIITALEHDTLYLCQLNIADPSRRATEPPPAATAAVDAAIQLFAQLLPLQDVTQTTRVVTQLLGSVGSQKLEKNTGRKAAALVNTTFAVVLTLRQTTSNSARQVLGNSQVSAPLSTFLKEVLVDGDPVLRKASSEAIGRLASVAGTNFLTSQVKTLVDQVVSNRDPHGRAGCALAFGAIHAYVGGLAAGPLLKTTVHVLMSLINDPHPVVHFWALSALGRVINAASLAYAPFVSSTLGLLFKVYMMESHEPDGGSLNQVNISGDLPAYQVVCQNIDAVITVLGPDIQESARTRTLVLDLVHQFIDEEDDGSCVEAIKCIQHFLMFAPDQVNVPELVTRFRGYLSSSRRPLKLASINALYQLVQRDALSMSKLGGDQLVEELFAMLDDDSSVDGVRNVIASWLQQTVIYNPSAWIDLCQRIMSRTTASQQAADAAMADDEGQSLSVGTSSSAARPTSRWRTQLFALQCLHSICTVVGRSGRREHLDIAFARSQGIPVHGVLVSRVPDLIKIAFTASAAHVTEIRLEGLTVLTDVIEIFARVPDPDYEENLLLEQHQAPITAALTPAFSSDSTPEILASAIGTCAIYVGCGVVKDVGRMGRILRLLTSALEQSKGSGMLTLGDAAELSPNASVMLRIATLSAWAELEVASTQQPYLVQVVTPYRAVLAPLWISTLRDYASIRIDAEALDDTPTGALDSSYSSLGREVLLPYYIKAWPIILNSVAIAMQNEDPSILAAMDGLEAPSLQPPTKAQNENREEPTVFFFVVFGLVYEALATSTADAGPEAQRTSIVSLQALKCLVQRKYCGGVFNDPPLYEELLNLFYRMALTEPSGVQIHLVETIASLAESIKSTSMTNGHTNGESVLQSPRAHCLRICAYILRRVISGPRSGAVHDAASPAEKVKLIIAAFEAFSGVASSFGPSQREDFRAVAITLYCELLKDETSEFDLVGPTLQALKALLDRPANLPDPDNKFGRIVHGLLSACLINIDEMSGREGPMCNKKIKCNMLAAVLILTVLPPTVPVGTPIIEHACFLISQKLVEGSEVSLTAAHCAKTLVMASTSGNPVLRQCARLLLPGLVECLAKAAASSDEPNPPERMLATVGEINKALSALFMSLTEELRPRALGVIMPVLILFLDPARQPALPLHTLGVTQLLSLAAASPTAFKDATGRLEPSTRETLETSVRQALGSKGPVAEVRPQISLRSF
ncbi:clathrin-coated vesicle protein [Daedaleopsis nitida]|nr:clathrin-coated vesicle protein [Daedaleopsis nitida]